MNNNDDKDAPPPANQAPKKAPDYLTRWRIPLGLAVAVLLTLNLTGVDWFRKKQAPVRPAAESAPASQQAAVAAPSPASAKLDPATWLVKIDALLKAGDARTAQAEWSAFKQANPNYPVAEELQRRLAQLKK
ncbi:MULTISPECIES: hypothetical protein [unclassified Janthinobacterium]|uniref:hypothetical protein n=1 Tax=unclassified Janthinobacterium TaxID=2610881 RepID=UPI001608AF11|nr:MULTISPECIES: hypothetical protein [unclassified Janthinobacterium]MBB5368182.1 hypothetical protein [Janthinobacterium sp. K2C7]MBB5379341.1 hypothetical protein [Janthinobacterium sp. K2Li3]MBB5386564.1 hypothetical protein [Janthinobacterium sp. K2E3]